MILVSEELWERAKEEARAAGISVSELVRRRLEGGTQNSKISAPKNPEPRHVASGIVSGGESKAKVEIARQPNETLEQYRMRCRLIEELK